MVDRNFILKSLDDAIVKCKPNFETMHTVKQIARYFGYKYEGLLNEMPKEAKYWSCDGGWSDFDLKVEGKVYKFTDPKNDNLPFYVYEDLLDTKTGRLIGDTYKDVVLDKDEWYNYLDFENLDEKSKEIFINATSYPLKEFFKDYEDLPEQFKKSIGELVIDRHGGTIGGHTLPLLDEDKPDKNLIIMHRPSIEQAGFSFHNSEYFKNRKHGWDNEFIRGDMRYVLFHEVNHALSHYLGYNRPNRKDDAEFDMEFLQRTNAYVKGRKLDEKLTGDKYAGDYATSAKSFSEDCADTGALMLLKALSKNDKNYNRRVMFKYPKGGAYPPNREDVFNIDDFLKRYPNRVNGLNKYLDLEL